MSKTIHHPFDKLVKNTLHNIDRAKEFLEAHISDKTEKYVNVNSTSFRYHNI